MSTIITAETLRGYGLDLRGQPVGEHVEAWESTSTATRPPGRPGRQHVTIMHCPQGWHSIAGTPDKPMGRALCQTLTSGRWTTPRGVFDHKAYHAHHDRHPVVWVITIRGAGRPRTLRYCDPELPAEYRPEA
jgi:hypothetical protein